jgi:hypothetical protein
MSGDLWRIRLQPKWVALALVTVPVPCWSAPQQSYRIDRYDDLIQVQLDGSAIETRTVDATFLREESHYYFWFAQNIASGGYRFVYGYEVISSEVDFGRGFVAVKATVRPDPGYFVYDLSGGRAFPRHARIRFKVRALGRTFTHGAGSGFLDSALAYWGNDGALASVTVEVPLSAADGARFVFVTGPRNGMDATMVCRTVPVTSVPGFFFARFLAPNRASYQLKRRLGPGEAITAAVYMPKKTIPSTMRYERVPSPKR